MAKDRNNDQIDDSEDITVTLTLDDGTDMECMILTIFEAEGRDYIALLPLEGEDAGDGEVYIYRYKETDGQPELENIDDDDEFEAASDAFDMYLDDQEFDELVDEEDVSEYSDED